MTTIKKKSKFKTKRKKSAKEQEREKVENLITEITRQNKETDKGF